MIIRPVRVDDLPLLAALRHEKNTILAAARSQSAPSQDLTNWTVEMRAWIDPVTCGFFVVEDSERVVGYIVGVLLPPIPGVSAHPIGAVTDLALDAHGYHGGAGRALVEAVRTWLSERGAQRVMVMVPRFYAPEQAFWRALGAVMEVDVMWLK